MTNLLDGSLVNAYRRDGVVTLKNVVSTSDLQLLAKGIERNMQSPGPWANEYTPSGSPSRFFDDYVNWQRIPEFEKVGTTGSLPRMALELMDCQTARLFHEHILVKEAETKEVTPWHHDDPYYGLDGMDNVSIWIPLDPIPSEIALRFIAGSHRSGNRFIPRRFKDQSAYVESANEFVQLPPIEELERQATITTPVEPGDAVAFHFRTLHAAPGTAGTNIALRRAVSFRYVGEDARFASRPWKTSPPLEGNGLNFGDPLEDPRFPIVATRYFSGN